MLRALWLILLLGILAVATMWLADNPGQASLNWQGYVIETSAAVLVSIVVAIAIVSALIYRLWIFIRGIPGGVSRHRREGRRRRGYLALTRGMVAVAAGDTGEARRQAHHADDLLDEPSLTMLLSAQSAQLTGDEKAAQKFFTEMLNNPDTEFLGLRGLINQAMKLDDHVNSLKWVRRAYLLKPESDWVAHTLFDLASRDGLWAEADEALAGAVRKKQVTASDVRHSRAVLSHQISLEAAAAGDSAKALKMSKKACNEAPDFSPAHIHHATLLKASGKHRKAIGVLESAWNAAPHPEIATAYWPATGADDAMARMKAAQKLASFNSGHPVTLMMLARVALEASLWGEARNSLRAIEAFDEPVSSGYCQLMAQLEELEHSDLTTAREWLVRAANADSDPSWICKDCGNAATTWTALCGGCGGFDTFQWRKPSRVPGLSAPEVEPPRLASADGTGMSEQLDEAVQLTSDTTSTDVDAPRPSQ
jgi:HemY protein